MSIDIKKDSDFLWLRLIEEEEPLVKWKFRKKNVYDKMMCDARGSKSQHNHKIKYVVSFSGSNALI